MRTTELCETCGDTAYHYPVGHGGYCCQCYNAETPCPDVYCDSHDTEERKRDN